MTDKRHCWITWNRSARSRTLARALNVALHEISIESNLLARHVLSPLLTIRLLIKERPRVVYLQYSFLLLIVVAIYKLVYLFRTVIVCDCHTKAIRRTAPGPLNWLFWPLKKLSFRFADVTIVSNTGMTDDIRRLHSNFYILPDKIPVISFDKPRTRNATYYVYISSFAVDEPVREIFEVAAALNPNEKIYWTGRIPHDFHIPADKPRNLIFTGYLNDADYHSLIGNADCLLALTTEENCLQCGAYEALAVNVPMILSDTYALRQYFGEAAIYTNHTPHNIVQSLHHAISNKTQLTEEMEGVATRRRAEFERSYEEFTAAVTREIARHGHVRGDDKQDI
jgi:glycosyltransferase involved in cell wall biosynthesis